ncbi:MAG: glycosyltransferase [Lachnospiraceae bacterium]|nr:glycosyltransferase [Lachnospiraceae bacterium]
MGIRERIKEELTKRCEQQYEKDLAAKKVTYKEWLAGHGDALFAGGQEARQQSGSVLLLQASDGVLASGAEDRIRSYFHQHPEVMIAYGDEDVQDPATDEFVAPWFKPDWSPDTFLSEMYWGNVVAIRRDWLEKLQDLKAKDLTAEALSEDALKESLAKLAVEAGGFEPGCQTIGHIPYVLFHADSAEQQTRCRALCMKDAVERLLGKESKATPMVSVIIPSKDHPEILKQGLLAVYDTLGEDKCEILVVDNGSSRENRQQIEEFLKEAPVPISYLYEPMEFHFSRMCNLGAQHAKGEFLLFLNDDVEMRCQGWMERMVEKASQPHAGAVGMKLYYPDSVRMQHDGIVNLPMGPVHKLQFLEDDQEYYYGFNTVDRNVLAVTGACLMVRREKYIQAGGMSEELPVAFNDVDLCFRLWELGYHNIILNSVYGWHHESLSRGDDESPQKLKRLLGEKEKLYRKHPQLKEGRDPYYSESLNRDGLDTGIRPAYVTAGNHIQISAPVKKKLDLGKYRRDNCLLYRVERCEEECIQGYGVVLGDNNACYDRTLVLWNPEEACPEQYALFPEQDALFPEAGGKITCYCIPLTGQYRPELAENMMDQSNVALCGFWWKPEPGSLPEGRYRLGMTARSKTGGTRLINWSSHELQTGWKGWNEK